MLPSCWGSAMWHVIHSISYVYNPYYDKQKYYEFFISLGNILPCEDCRSHYKQNLDKTELMYALGDNETMFRWSYDLHNKVNIQTGVPSSKWPSYETVKNKYGGFKASCSEIPGVCGSTKPGPHKSIKIIEQFGANINDEQYPLFVSTVVLSVLLFLFLVAAFMVFYFKPFGKY